MVTKNQSFIEVTVLSYEESNDTFKIDVPCPGVKPGSLNDQIDVEFFSIPSGLFAFLVGEWDEPTDFVGKSFTLLSHCTH